MVFNTGAALLDAIVLAVVSKEKEGTYGCAECSGRIGIHSVSRAPETEEG